jgi:ATP-dependent RNA helicase DDX10/DBP4
MNLSQNSPLGRLLQHMDDSQTFDYAPLKILILDEADRILDMGFSDTLNHILESLPKKRQTLLFSATLRPNVKQLASMALRQPQVGGRIITNEYC